MVACRMMANLPAQYSDKGFDDKGRLQSRERSPCFLPGGGALARRHHLASARVDARSISLIGTEHMAARRHTWALKAFHEIPGLGEARFPAIGSQVQLALVCRRSRVTRYRAFEEGRAGHPRAFHVSYGP